MVQQLVESQADGWTHATDEIGRYYDWVAPSPRPSSPRRDGSPSLRRRRSRSASQEAMGAYIELALKLGRRTGEMHLALAADTTDPAFAPEPFSKDDLKAFSSEPSRWRSAPSSLSTPGCSSPRCSPATPTTPQPWGGRPRAGPATGHGSRCTARPHQIGAAVRVRLLQDSRARRLPPRAGPVGRG